MELVVMTFAIVIDDNYINWLLGLIAVALPTIGTTIVLLWKKFLAYITPKVTEAFNAHTGLVNEMKLQIPIVGKTLKKLGDTQEKQCDTLERHSKWHEQHAEKLNKLMTSWSDNHEVQP
jgi:hypothetical protein